MNDRIRELEEELRKLKSSVMRNGDGAHDLTTNQTPGAAVLTHNSAPAMPIHLDPLAELGVNKKYYNWDIVSMQKSNLQQQTYGTSSSFYFIRQMITYMEACDESANPDNYASCVYTPSESIYYGNTSRIYDSPESMVRGCDLSRSAEQDCLSSFWELSNFTAPILARDSFEAHYNALWNHSRTPRSPSALVDIMLALCIQHEAQIFINDSQNQRLGIIKGVGPDAAGLWWYRRSQQLLSDDLEEPSIATFQCYLLSVIWLSNAGRHNTAHIVMASCIRIGIVLGLHLEPPKRHSIQQREYRKRLWWISYALEMKFAMELGRPLAINCKQVTCTLPCDDIAVPQFHKDELLFTVHLVKLLLTIRAVYITFYRQCAEELGKSGKESIYEDPEVLEQCAKFMASRTVYLHTWTRNVPSVLHMKRRDTQPYCVDSLDFVFESFGEDFADRRNIFLEMHYHAMALNLFRPFIDFSVKHRLTMPYTHKHALSCVKHALAITSVLRQMCVNSKRLNGFLEVWHWQWSAALALVGYILAYPKSPAATDARSSIDLAMLVLRSCGKYAAAEVICQLLRRADSFNSRSRRTTGSDDPGSAPEQDSIQAINLPGIHESGWSFDQSTSIIDDMSDNLSSVLTAEGILSSLSALGDLDAVDQNIFEFLNFDDIGAM